jgi:hypothetical protein
MRVPLLPDGNQDGNLGWLSNGWWETQGCRVISLSGGLRAERGVLFGGLQKGLRVGPESASPS